MNSYDVYLFDFDGTLVDSFESLVYVFQFAYGKIGINVPREDVKYLMRCPLFEGYQKYQGKEEDKSIFGDAINAGLDDPYTLSLTELYPDTLTMLNRLKSGGAKLGIVTSNAYRHVIDVLNVLNIDVSLFDVIVGHDQCVETKPSPEPVHTAVKLLKEKYPKDKIVYIGDSINDVEAGIRGGYAHYLLDRYGEYENTSYRKIKTLEEIL